MKKKIIVADDEPLIAILMKDIIEEEPQFEIARMVSGKAEFMQALGRESFDAALVDMSMDGREGGMELLQAVRAQEGKVPLIMLSAHDEFLYALKCLRAGARGYISKRYICSDVVTCLKEVLKGNLFVSGDKGSSIVNQYQMSLVS